MNWKRGEESLEMLEPRPVKMDILGLGRSVNTTEEEGIIAEAVVVRSFDELDALPDSEVNTIYASLVITNETL